MFFTKLILYSYFGQNQIYCLMAQLCNMVDMNPPDTENPSQQKRHQGCKPVLPNYQNIKFIPINEHIFPNGSKSWRLAVIAYKEESGKDALWTEDVLQRNWFRSCVTTTKHQLVPQANFQTKFIPVLKLTVTFRKV